MRSTRVISGSESCASCAARSTSVDVLEEEKSGGDLYKGLSRTFFSLPGGADFLRDIQPLSP